MMPSALNCAIGLIMRGRIKPVSVYAVDFDGYLCEDAWPSIGEPRFDVIRHFRELRQQGHKLILWTCREETRYKARLNGAQTLG